MSIKSIASIAEVRQHEDADPIGFSCARARPAACVIGATSRFRGTHALYFVSVEIRLAKLFLVNNDAILRIPSSIGSGGYDVHAEGKDIQVPHRVAEYPLTIKLLLLALCTRLVMVI